MCHTQLGTIIGFETVNGNCYDVTDNGERGARFVTVVCESVCGCLSDHRTSAVQRISRATELPPSESSRSVVRLDVVTLIARISADVFSINNNNNNKHDNVYGAVIMAEPLREFTRFI